MKHEIQKHGIELTLELDKDLPLIAADPIQIEQVLINLIRNSLEAIRQAHVMKGKIFIQSVVVNGDNESQIIITDNGPGVGEEDKHRIFDPFVTAKSGEGMGMGLSISRSIIEAHHGKLSVASEPGRGARFSFTLPVDNHLYQ